MRRISQANELQNLTMSVLTDRSHSPMQGRKASAFDVASAAGTMTSRSLSIARPSIS